MLDATGKKAFAVVDFLGLSVDVEKADAHLVGPDHIAENVRERKTPFVVIYRLGVFFRFPFRIEHHIGLGILFAGNSGVNDHQTDVLTYLGCGKAAARRVVHGFQHVLGQLAEFRSNLGNGFALFAENRVTVNADR